MSAHTEKESSRAIHLSPRDELKEKASRNLLREVELIPSHKLGPNISQVGRPPWTILLSSVAHRGVNSPQVSPTVA